MPRHILTAALLALLVSTFSLSGCRSKLTGNEGNLEFSYFADDRVLDFNKPIAVYAKLDLDVATVGNSLPAQVISASSDQPGVLRVVDTQNATITVEGVASGNVLLQVEAKPLSGATVSDSVNLTVREPEVLEMRHTCEEGAAAKYLADQEVWVAFDLEMANGQPVIGYGYYPVVFDPVDAATLDMATKDQQWFHLTATTVGPLTITSTIDATSLVLDVVEQGAIDGAELVNATANAKVGEDALFFVRPTSGGAPICQARTEFTVTSTTPDICTVVRSVDGPNGPDAFLTNEAGWLTITGVALGICEFELSYGKAAGGAGLTVPLSVDVIEVLTP